MSSTLPSRICSLLEPEREGNRNRFCCQPGRALQNCNLLLLGDIDFCQHHPTVHRSEKKVKLDHRKAKDFANAAAVRENVGVIINDLYSVIGKDRTNSARTTSTTTAAG
jgi:hypothetical protein